MAIYENTIDTDVELITLNLESVIDDLDATRFLLRRLISKIILTKDWEKSKDMLDIAFTVEQLLSSIGETAINFDKTTESIREEQKL